MNCSNDYDFIDEKTLNILNKQIDGVIYVTKSFPMDYTLLEKICKVALMDIKFRPNSPIQPIALIKKDEMIKIVLDFFQSIDSDLYALAFDALNNKNSNIKTNIYNIHAVQDFEKLNEFQHPEYLPEPVTLYKNGKVTIYIPTQIDLSSKESNIFSEDDCTLEDLYALLHETAHLFDLDISTDIQNETRETFSESTAISCEYLFTDYLRKNYKFSEHTLIEYMKKRENSAYIRVATSYAKLVLAKEKNGIITKEYIEQFARKNQLSPSYIKNIIIHLTHPSYVQSILFDQKYAIAKVIAPTIASQTRKNGSDTLLKYIQAVKNNNPTEVLNALRIQTDEQGLNNLIANMMKESTWLDEKERVI